MEDPNREVTTTASNAFGEVISRVMPQGAESWTYGGFGRPVDHVLATGDTIRNQYHVTTGDWIGEQWLESPAAGDLLTEREYDIRGRVTVMKDHNLGRAALGYPPITVTNTMSYDALDRTLSESVEIGGVGFTTTSTWAATGDSWTRTLTYPSGKQVARRFDGAGRLDQIQVEGRNIDFTWTGEIPTGRVHQWSTDPSASPMRRFVDLDGLGDWCLSPVSVSQDTHPRSVHRPRSTMQCIASLGQLPPRGAYPARFPAELRRGERKEAGGGDAVASSTTGDAAIVAPDSAGATGEGHQSPSTRPDPHHDDVGRRRVVGLGLRVLSLPPGLAVFADLVRAEHPARHARPCAQREHLLGQPG